MASLAGEMVDSALRKKGMTQEELAEKIGRRQTLISRFITGVSIANTTAQAIANELDINANELTQLIQRDKLERGMKKLKAQYIPVLGEKETEELLSDKKNADVGHVGIVPDVPLLNSYNQNPEKAERYIVPTGVELDENKSFALKVIGKSMTDDKIDEGDIILVDTSAKVKDKDRVLVVRNGQQELRAYQKVGDLVLLQSSTIPEASTIIPSQDENTKIIGRVIFLHKTFS
ncbi:MAG: XRE family transcriptional regulator [Candidatus Poribacteria bacterium]